MKIKQYVWEPTPLQEKISEKFNDEPDRFRLMWCRPSKYYPVINNLEVTS